MLSPQRNRIETADYIMEPVEDFKIFDGFCCGDDDLNDFIHNDAARYADDLLDITYSFRLKQDELISDPVAFASILNDAIRNFNKSQRRKLFANGKRSYEQYPAVKIGRFGVDSRYKNLKIGKFFLNALKDFFVTRNRTGCRFITVDAYRDISGFYEKSDFSFLLPSEVEKDERTVSMYLDLKRIVLQRQAASQA